VSPTIAARLRRALAARKSAPAAPCVPPGLLELLRTGPAPLIGAPVDPDAALRIAALVPSFRKGSGGHATIVSLLEQLRRRGHAVSVWLEDNEGRHASESPELTRRSFNEFFAADGLQLQTDRGAWRGAEIVLATGWQTVPRALLLPDVAARAYLVQDHEPDFYGVSAESLWAAWTYRQGLRCIAASPWLADLLRTRYGAATSHFDLAVDHSVYAPGRVPGRRELVVFYARAVTPRRAVPLGLLALGELARRRPELQIALYGEARALEVDFAHRQLGVLDTPGLADLYRRAGVGMVLSLTNPSLIGLEMMACGLPCVELASAPMLASFGANGPLELAGPDPLELCGAIERLLDDDARRERAMEGGQRLVAGRTWERASEQVEAALRAAVSAHSIEQAGRHPDRSGG
jgi:glycosyltransferase involved in cell wall biosynthesis